MSDYWKEQEIQKDFQTWTGFYEGCVACACGHGCLAWIEQNHSKIALIAKIAGNPKATTSLDKIAQMPIEKADKIWMRLFSWAVQRANRPYL